MTKKMIQLAALLAVSAVIVAAQATLPPQPGQQAPAQAKPQPEIADLQTIVEMQVTSVPQADAKIKAVDDWALKYPNAAAEVKAFAFSLAAETSQMKGDSPKAVFYYEKVLQAKPDDYMSMLMIAAETAQKTQEFDLDKDQKLGRAEKLIADALKLIEPAPKPNPQLTDEQWTAIKKDDTARAHEALGMVAMARKNYDGAIKEFQTAIDSSASPQPATYVRLGGALNEAKKPDEAIAALDKVLAMPNLHPVIKDVAENEKKRSQQLKSGAKQ